MSVKPGLAQPDPTVGSTYAGTGTEMNNNAGTATERASAASTSGLGTSIGGSEASLRLISDNEPSNLSRAIPALGGPMAFAASRAVLIALGYSQRALDTFEEAWPIYRSNIPMTVIRYYDGVASFARGSYLTTFETVNKIESTGISPNTALKLPGDVSNKLEKAIWQVGGENGEYLIGRVKDGAAWAIQILVKDPVTLKAGPGM